MGDYNRNRRIIKNSIMLTNKDLAKIVAVVATREDMDELKKDVNGLRESVQALTISVDGLVNSKSGAY